MKILILNGSPKGNGSNTLKLTNAFVQGVGQAVTSDIHTVDVYKLNIRDCTGCFGCWNKTPGKCVLQDDMADILQKILAADIIIWSFPLYHFSVPARLKAVIDRQLPLYLPTMAKDAEFGGHEYRHSQNGKRHVVISTCGFYTAEGNYTAVTAQFDRMFGANGYTSIYCGQGELFSIPELKKRTGEYLADVKAAGNEYAGGAISKDTKKKLDSLLFPREVFEQMADAHWGNADTDDGLKHACPALAFTKQMAAMYNNSSWKDDKVLEFYYTDEDKTYQIQLLKDGHKVLEDNFLPYTTRIETSFSTWQKISRGEISGEQALMEHLYNVKGDFNLLLKWNEYFGIGNAAPAEKIQPNKKNKYDGYAAALDFNLGGDFNQ